MDNKFITRIIKQESLNRQYSKLCDLLTFKQYQTMSQNTNRYEALAIRAKSVSSKRAVHAAADELLRLSKIEVMSDDERSRQYDMSRGG